MLSIENEKLPVPTGPGLGVQADPAKVERYTKSEIRDQVFDDADNPDFIPRIGVIM